MKMFNKPQRALSQLAYVKVEESFIKRKDCIITQEELKEILDIYNKFRPLINGMENNEIDIWRAFWNKL